MFQDKLPNTQGVKFKNDISTEGVIDSTIQCCEKGCLSDPLPVKRITYGVDIHYIWRWRWHQTPSALYEVTNSQEWSLASGYQSVGCKDKQYHWWELVQANQSTSLPFQQREGCAIQQNTTRCNHEHLAKTAPESNGHRLRISPVPSIKFRQICHHWAASIKRSLDGARLC